MYDLLLRGGTFHDGLGSPERTADVAISAGRVVTVGTGLGTARRTIEVSGLCVAPGFVDPHCHSDLVPLMEQAQPFKLLQGVTTEVNGNCGFSYAPMHTVRAAENLGLMSDFAGGLPAGPWSFADYLDEIEAAGPTNHMATLVGHSTLRLAVAGFDAELNDAARAQMCRLADEAFAQGAYGLSSGLIYPPGAYGDIDELTELAMVAHGYGRPYTTHMRDEGAGLAEALDEAIEIARRARVRLQVSHCKAAGGPNHGASAMLLAKLHEARVAGVDARGDQYPYLAGATLLSALVPPEALTGGTDAARALLTDPGERARLRAIATDPARTIGAGLWRDTDPDGVLITAHTRTGVVGRTIAEVSGTADAWATACELIAADPAAFMVITMMAEDDVQAIMADALICIGSDNGLPAGLEHPRTWGCFPRFLGRYVRELGVVDWAEAIRKTTSAAAAQLGLTGRGRLGPGAPADVCVFDPLRIGHPGDYRTPDVKPAGIEYVLLEGQVVVEAGEFTGDRLGRVLRA